MIKRWPGAVILLSMVVQLGGEASAQEADADALEATVMTVGSERFSPNTPCRVGGNLMNQCKYTLATTKYVAVAVQQSVDTASSKLEVSLIDALDKLSRDAVAAEAVSILRKDYDNRIDELQQKLTSLQRQLADLQVEKKDGAIPAKHRSPNKRQATESSPSVHK